MRKPHMRLRKRLRKKRIKGWPLVCLPVKGRIGWLNGQLCFISSIGAFVLKGVPKVEKPPRTTA